MKPGAPLSRNTPLTARTPLRTHTGLQASAPWSRSVPLLTTAKSAATARRGLTSWVPPQPAGVDPARRAAARTRTGFSRKVKLKVRTRAGNGDPDLAMCEACGLWLGRRHGQVQHRAARGAGGCKDEVINGPANAALLCGTPHTGCHGRATAFEEGMGPNGKGFWLKHGTTPDYDPRNAAIMLASPHGSGMRVWLAADGKGPNGDGYLTERPGAWAA